MLKELFLSLTGQYTADVQLTQQLWMEIEKNYTGKKRHYHNLHHLENLVRELSGIKELIHDWDAVVLALFYHDIIYKAQRNDNEEQSALLATKHLLQLNCKTYFIDRVYHLISATKSHQLNDDTDINYFTDADLSILGNDWDAYNDYCSNVRKEYTIYPDILYKPGRKKALQHFLSMDRIFKTEHFYNKYETAARKNIERENSML